MKNVAFVGLILVTSIALAMAGERNTGAPRARAGEPSTYDKYSGKAKITRIEKTTASKAQAQPVGGPGYEGYELWFSFVPDQNIKQEWARDSIKKEHLLQLANSWYPGDKYIQKYGIETNKVYKCILLVITSGTSSPICFEFQDLNSTDYFETAK